VKAAEKISPQSSHTNQLSRDLQERIKELTCLYNVGFEIESRKGVATVLESVTQHLIAGLQYPDIAAAAVHFDRIRYLYRLFSPSQGRNSLKTDIACNGKKRGYVEAVYLQPCEFLEEEKKLVKEIGRMISRYLEKQELQKELKKYVGNLKSLVKAKTKELEKSVQRFEDLFENAPDGQVISTPKGDVIKANRAFYRMLQYPEDGSVKLNYVRDHLYQDIQHVRPFIFRELKRKGKVEGVEMTLIDSRGNHLPVIGSLAFIEFAGKKHIHSIYKDIRQRKELETKLIEQKTNLENIVQERTKALEEQKKLLVKKNVELLTLSEKFKVSHKQLRTLFTAITDMVVMIDTEHNVLVCNKPGGCTAASKCFEVTFQRNAPCESCLAQEVILHKKALNREQKVGEEFYLMQTYPIFNENDEVDGVLEISRNITHQKHMEMQLIQTDKLAALGQLVSGIAHEINNPNTFLKGNIAIIREALQDILPILDRHCTETDRIARLRYDVFRSNIPVLVDDMVQGTDRIKAIVDGLRKFAKRDDGILNDEVQLNEIIDSSLRLSSNQISRKARVNLRLTENLPLIKGNFQRLEQIIVNILINASQAIDKEKGVITVATASLPKEHQVMVQISDNGCGMEEKTKKQIFDPFFTTKRNQGGTGLGLSVAYGILKEHRGTIDVTSKVGEGTTFTLRFPTPMETDS